MIIRNATVHDAAAICGIYNPYVSDTWVTFEEEHVPVEDMKRRIEEVSRSFDWLVIEDQRRVLGYAYSNRWRVRAAYRYSVECTIYLAQDAARRGYGTQLYSALLARQQERGMHCAMGGIALPNAASVALHEKLGFQKVAHFQQVGWKLGQWRDVGYWQRQL